MGIYGVTYDNPPRSALFEDFHSRRPEAPLAAPAPAPAPTLDVAGANPLMTALVAMMLGQGIPAAQPAVPHPPAELAAVDESSKGPVVYMDIDIFLERLAEENPKHNLSGLAEKLTNCDFYCIDELADVNEAFFQAAPYNLSQGNAMFVVKSIKVAIAEAKKAAK